MSSGDGDHFLAISGILTEIAVTGASWCTRFSQDILTGDFLDRGVLGRACELEKGMSLIEKCCKGATSLRRDLKIDFQKGATYLPPSKTKVITGQVKVNGTVS